MSEPDVAYPTRDEAFHLTIDLADHILENANAFHVLGSAEGYPGRGRLRFALLLVMFQEMGKLIPLVQSCEKAAKADYINVRVEDFHNNCLSGRKAAAQLSEELRTVEQAAASFSKGESSSAAEPAFLKEDFCHLVDAQLYLDLKERGEKALPTDVDMDRYAQIIEHNAIAAGEYIHDLSRALGLWMEPRLKRHSDQNAAPYY